MLDDYTKQADGCKIWKCLHCGAPMGMMIGHELAIGRVFILSGKIKCRQCKHTRHWIIPKEQPVKNRF